MKKPSWADVYTDHATTETEEEGGTDWTPERGRFGKSNADLFKPRAPPIIGSAAGKNDSEYSFWTGSYF